MSQTGVSWRQSIAKDAVAVLPAGEVELRGSQSLVRREEVEVGADANRRVAVRRITPLLTGRG